MNKEQVTLQMVQEAQERLKGVAKKRDCRIRTR